MINIKYYKQARIITTDEQLQNCVQSGVEIEIFITDKVEYIGKMIAYSKDSIKTTEGSYLRESCIVKTKENYFSII